jgi:hypothetical protein
MRRALESTYFQNCFRRTAEDHGELSFETAAKARQAPALDRV